MNIASFTFGPFAENTYLVYDDTGVCLVIDPGCNDASEQQVLVDFIESNQLQPRMLVNTHCHIDHVLGNRFISDKYHLELYAHKGETPVLESCVMVASMYQIPYNPSPSIEKFLDEGDTIEIGEISFSILFTPGHSPASISLYNAQHNTLIAGDVLFRRSIGRTDLPGGDMDTLLSNIRNKLFTLPAETTVYSGHGPSTTIGEEIRENPFLQS